MIALADPASSQLIGLLLTGLAPHECAELGESDLDLDAALVRVPGDGRSLPLSPGLVALFAAHSPVPLWTGATGSAAVENLGARIGLLAHDAGLVHPAEIGMGALRHTYLCYLVRQGARLTELERIVGQLPAAELARYGVYRPAGAGTRPLGELDLGYPALGG